MEVVRLRVQIAHQHRGWTHTASSAVRILVGRTDCQVEPVVGHSLVWTDPPKGTARAFLAREETQRAPFLVASLPGSSPYPTRAP